MCIVLDNVLLELCPAPCPMPILFEPSVIFSKL